MPGTDYGSSDAFCIAPWIHLHALANGDVYPCCVSRMTAMDRYGSLRDGSIAGILNGDRAKALRQDMLAGRRPDACAKCHEHEDHGFPSMRQNLNRSHLAQSLDMVASTAGDGSIESPRLRYVDIRFSNQCNMRCRTCGPTFSSQWHDDHETLRMVTDMPMEPSSSRVQRARYDDMLMEELVTHIPHMDSVYFAGGEPLIMPEVWQLLDAMLERGRDDIACFFQTNMSTLSYKDRSMIDIWKRLRRVTVTASLDARGSASDYVRAGSDWARIEANMRQARIQCPDLRLRVSCTVSNLNMHLVTDLHRYLCESGLVGADDFEINPVQVPEMYRVTNSPDSMRQRVVDEMDGHIRWLSSEHAHADAAKAYFVALRSMLMGETTDHRADLRTVTLALDAMRKQDLRSVNPGIYDWMVNDG